MAAKQKNKKQKTKKGTMDKIKITEMIFVKHK